MLQSYDVHNAFCVENWGFLDLKNIWKYYLVNFPLEKLMEKISRKLNVCNSLNKETKFSSFNKETKFVYLQSLTKLIFCFIK